MSDLYRLPQLHKASGHKNFESGYYLIELHLHKYRFLHCPDAHTTQTTKKL